MNLLLIKIRRTPLLWLLVFVPVVLVAEHLGLDSPTMLFVLSVLAIVPLAVLLSHATESVAAKTGDADAVKKATDNAAKAAADAAKAAADAVAKASGTTATTKPAPKKK